KRYHLGCAQDGLILHKSTRNNQSGFGKSITGIEEVWLETTGCKGRGKPFQSVRADRLSTVVRHLPTAEVDRAALLGSNLANAHFIREIGASTNCGFVMRNSLKPAHWPLKIGLRRHEHAPASSIQRLDNSVGKPHVMKNR